MDCDVLRVEGDGLTQALLEPFHRVAGQTRDEVHVDVVVACGPGLGIAVEDVLSRVLAANVLQYFIREGLRIDGDAGRAVFLDDGQLFGVGAVGASGFHRVFHDGGKVEAIPHRPHELAQLRCREAGGGAAADVDAAEHQPGLVSLVPDGLDLSAQAVHIGLHQLAVTVEVAADEAAIAAPGGAERDADIEAVGLGRTAYFQDRLLQVRDSLGHAVFFGRAVEALEEEIVDFLFRPACGPLVVDEAHRADAGHLAPGRADTRPAAHQVIGQAGQRKFRRLAALFHGNGQRCFGGLALAALPHHGPELVRPLLGPDAVCAVLGRGEGERGHWVEQADEVLHLVARAEARDIDIHVKSRLFMRFSAHF